ncbi:helix-turn-helix domain-containing protein [Streptomyces drozdowiczii]|uniref:Helix-turn-helix domain-containing protein n=1 Tax=Streptomyces drozdowiczii TaxID=202862 RepID=A0ABY6Q006_9ACTN|nr:helix-turn-helix domain-containing protein [Streptomyces drozdowiczii]MCX0241944.1 helix-turn-helix domain-containing protein [Streptomyces drozdowiczii]UZK57945.1 helix-turn-helix domain-containing protein [Streptomyces drozdowiczii]
MTVSSLGRLVRRLRLARALTIEQLAEASGVSVRAIGDMERGRSTKPRHGTVAALMQGLRLGEAEAEELFLAARADRSDKAADVPAPTAHFAPLPRGIRDFVGREDELRVLGNLIEEGTRSGAGRAGAAPPLPPVAVVSGVPGSGKTTLALRLAEERRSDFPDGAFFIDLRGLEDRPPTPDETVVRLLNAWGVDDAQVGRLTSEERLALYQSTAAGLRAVLVLDNAGHEAQVRALLPAEGRMLVVVTSRRPLAGLSGVHRLALGTLARSESTALLRAVVADGRVDADPDAAARVAVLCGHLPLALRVAANWAATRSGWTLGRLADRLADEDRRMDALSAGDLGVASAFHLSYSRLAPETARVFRLLSLIPGGDFGIPYAAVLAETSAVEAENRLEELLEAGLLMTSVGDRYRFHDLLRLYGRARSRDTDDEATSVAAAARLRGWLLDTVAAAAQVATGGVEAPERGDSTASPEHFRTREQALEWLRAESDNWLSALRREAEQQNPGRVVVIAFAVEAVCNSWISWGNWSEVFALGARSAEATGDLDAQAGCLSMLAWVHWQCHRRHEEALEAATSALAIASACGSLGRQAEAYMYLGWLRDVVNDVVSAVEDIAQAMDLFLRAGDTRRYLQAANMNITVLRKAGRGQEAIETHHAVMGSLAQLPGGVHDPRYAVTVRISRYHVAFVYLNEGRWEEAAEVLAGLEQSYADSGFHLATTKIYLYRGHCLAHLGLAAEAEGDYRAVLGLGDSAPVDLREEARAGLAGLSAGALPSRTAFE